jgi:hypothetical protein
MPTYPPRNSATKKAEILSQKVFEFLRLHDDNADLDRLIKKAEQLRIAKLNLLKARLALSKSFSAETSPDMVAINKLMQDRSDWETFSFDQIKAYADKVGRI